MSASVYVLLAMVLGTAALALYRKYVAREEDDLIHVNDPASGQLIAHQKDTDKALDGIDHAGKILTTATVVYGVALGCFWTYQAWMAATKLP